MTGQRPPGSELIALVDRFRGRDVVVLADLALDAWLDGEAERLCREGPVPVVDVSGSRLVPGGGGNAAANLAALGARPRLVSVVGDDPAGTALTGLLRDAGVDVSGLVAAPGRPTPTKRRLTANGQLVARFDETPPDRLDQPTAAALAAALLLGLAAGADPVDAVELAAIAAECTVHTTGTVVCDAPTLLRRLRRGRHGPADSRVLPAAELARMIGRYRQAGLRIVFTNGCFDVLHTGHVGYLEEASRLGDVLVVGLNSDASVARLKGPDRPVHSEEDRATLLAALAAVDHVTVFDEDSPVRLLELVRPDVYVKGGDYTPDMLPETPVVRRLGGEVRTLMYRSRRSSTGIIDRIRAGAGAGGQP